MSQGCRDPVVTFFDFSSCRYSCIEVVIYQLIEGYLEGIAGLQKILE
jgi:FKBP-type peptidyl-prolyl cis-trans isomerase